MRKSVLWALLSLLVLAPFFLAFRAVAEAAVGLGTTPAVEKPLKRDKVQLQRGKTTYRAYCANCHGKKAEGDGPMAEVMKIRPADLTRLSRDNGGEFPTLQTMRTIDGRADFISHGTRTMPIWGISFRCLDCDTDQEREVRERIEDLIAYLESLQK